MSKRQTERGNCSREKNTYRQAAKKKDKLRVANILTRFSDRFYRIFNTAGTDKGNISNQKQKEDLNYVYMYIFE